MRQGREAAHKGCAVRQVTTMGNGAPSRRAALGVSVEHEPQHGPTRGLGNKGDCP